ncbi:Transposase [Pacificibacter marinus]|uniref:Transposase n=1 Tax=Pacificibacter marinus TaxID=658057 RepID=A0A1Y5T4H6_9RHOB|nr:transposase [Pacificibacter marinus]SEL20681.1 Transposase [Pacificibacter marinus]SLN55619.1 Transposase [Pacificibacter marinus]
MEYYVGLDVSLRSCRCALWMARARFTLSESCHAKSRTSPTVLQLLRVGFEVVYMEARPVSAALSAMRNKTDKTDAKGVAQILRTGWFSPVHMKSREAHGLRALLSTRKALLKKTMDLANEVRGLLKIFGVRLPRTVKHGSFDGW